MARMQETLQFTRQRGVITLRSLLLLFTGGLLLLVLIAAVSVSFDRFRDYMTDQLRGHSQDGATAIGLSLSNAIDGRDPVAASSLIDAVFDSGRYLSVVYFDNQGEEVAGRETSLRELKVPGWFVSLADLPLPAGEAEVVRGWSRLGKVRVVSHPGRTYEDLWKVTSRTVAGSVLVAGVGLIGLFWMMTRLLVSIGGAIGGFIRGHSDSFAGRLTGAGFAVFLPGISRADGVVWCRQLLDELDGIYSDFSAPMDVSVHAGIAQAAENRNVRDLMAAANG